MSTNSLNSSISLGVQSGKGTAATAYKTSLAQDSSAMPKFDVHEPKLEHPAPAARATKVKAAQQRTGYTVDLAAKFLLRPRFIGMVLRGLGFGVAATGTSPAYTQTFTLAAASADPWLTALVKLVDDGGTSLERKITDVRLNKLTVEASEDEINCDIAGIGLAEGLATGSETKVAESTAEISPSAGSATITLGGATIASPIRGTTLEIASTIDDKDRVQFSAVRNSLPRSNIDVSGTLKGIDIEYNSYEWYYRTIYGNTSGTAPVLTAAVGTLTYNYTSLANIPTGVVPYKMTVTVPSLYWEMTGEPKSSGNNMVRVDMKWTMIDDSSTPVTIALVTDQATYT